jgi:hypothetical protein
VKGSVVKRGHSGMNGNPGYRGSAHRVFVNSLGSCMSSELIGFCGGMRGMVEELGDEKI